MNILVSTNDNYVMPLTVLLQSLFENNPGTQDIYFLWADLSEENRTFIEGFVSSHGSRFIPVAVDDDAFSGFATKDYISRETYFRLLAAQLLPSNVDRILWLDADMVVNGPLDEFFMTDFEGAAVVACPHGPAMRQTIREDCAQIGIEHPEQYFNAGVMLCNLTVWREIDVVARIREVFTQPRTFMFPGQDLTNLIFNGQVKTADWRVYNCMIHSVLPEDLPELEKVARIIHYVGRAKPWRFVDLPFSNLWKTYYDHSPYGDVPLRRTSFALMRRMHEKMQRGGASD